MKKEFENIEVGSIVNIQNDRVPNHEETIINITTETDEETGEIYKVFWCGIQGFDSRTGYEITEPYSAYINPIIRLHD